MRALAFADPDGRTASRTLIDGNWRMTIFEGSDLGELYDLEADPHELSNLWADNAAATQKSRMLHRMAERQMALQDTSLVSTHQA